MFLDITRAHAYKRLLLLMSQKMLKVLVLVVDVVFLHVVISALWSIRCPTSMGDEFPPLAEKKAPSPTPPSMSHVVPYEPVSECGAYTRPAPLKRRPRSTGFVL